MNTVSRSKLTFITTIAILLTALLIGQGALPSAVAAASPTVSTTKEVLADELAAPAQTITVVGKGVATTEPDTAEVTVGVEAVDTALDRAAEDSSSTLNDVIEAIEKLGIEETDIRRSDYNIWAETDWSDDSEDDADSDEDRNDGGTRYHVTNSVLVTVRDLDMVTAVIRTGVGEGANTMYGINYGLDDLSALEDEAREAAVADAQAKAEHLADLTGLTVGQVLSVSEVIGGSEAYSGYTMSSPGAIEVSVSLQITYAAK
ncbi:MAG: SIMPL domain-containing protein [Anaerolineales bacterium]